MSAQTKNTHVHNELLASWKIIIKARTDRFLLEPNHKNHIYLGKAILYYQGLYKDLPLTEIQAFIDELYKDAFSARTCHYGLDEALKKL